MEDCPGIQQLYDYFTYKRQRRLGEISDEKRAFMFIWASGNFYWASDNSKPFDLDLVCS